MAFTPVSQLQRALTRAVCQHGAVWGCGALPGPGDICEPTARREEDEGLRPGPHQLRDELSQQQAGASGTLPKAAKCSLLRLSCSAPSPLCSRGARAGARVPWRISHLLQRQCPCGRQLSGSRGRAQHGVPGWASGAGCPGERPAPSATCPLRAGCGPLHAVVIVFAKELRYYGCLEQHQPPGISYVRTLFIYLYI